MCRVAYYTLQQGMAACEGRNKQGSRDPYNDFTYASFAQVTVDLVQCGRISPAMLTPPKNFCELSLTCRVILQGN